jgi:hypothetical protein
MPWSIALRADREDVNVPFAIAVATSSPTPGAERAGTGTDDGGTARRPAIR